MKTLTRLLCLTFSFPALTAIIGVNTLTPVNAVQADSPKVFSGINTLIADARAIPIALVGRYVGSLIPVPGATCSLPVSTMTVIISATGDVSATVNQALGPNGATTKLSTSISPPLFTGGYVGSGSQGFWEGYVVSSQIIGRAGASNCRFRFTLLKR